MGTDLVFSDLASGNYMVGTADELAMADLYAHWGKNPFVVRVESGKNTDVICSAEWFESGRISGVVECRGVDPAELLVFSIHEPEGVPIAGGVHSRAAVSEGGHFSLSFLGPKPGRLGLGYLAEDGSEILLAVVPTTEHPTIRVECRTIELVNRTGISSLNVIVTYALAPGADVVVRTASRRAEVERSYTLDRIPISLARVEVRYSGRVKIVDLQLSSISPFEIVLD